MNTFIWAQIVGVINLIANFLCLQQKSKNKVLIFQIAINLLYMLQFLIIDIKTGIIISSVNSIRCIVFYIYQKKKLKPSCLVLFVFITATIVGGFVTWQNMYSTLAIIGTLLYTYALWQDNIKTIRKCSVIMSSGWIIYNLLIGVYSSAISEAMGLISALIAIIRYDILNKKTRKEPYKLT